MVKVSSFESFQSQGWSLQNFRQIFSKANYQWVVYEYNYYLLYLSNLSSANDTLEQQQNNFRTEIRTWTPFPST